MTMQQIKAAVAWLREQEKVAGLRQAEHLTDRRHRPRRVPTAPRDTKGRFTR